MSDGNEEKVRSLTIDPTEIRVSLRVRIRTAILLRNNEVTTDKTNVSVDYPGNSSILPRRDQDQTNLRNKFNTHPQLKIVLKEDVITLIGGESGV